MSERRSIPERLGHDFLQAMYHLIRTAHYYQDNNQLIWKSLRSFQSLLNEITINGDISLLLWRSHFYLGGEKLPYKRQATGTVNNMVEFFSKRGIGGVNFLDSSHDALPENIIMFIRLFIDSITHKTPYQWLEQNLLEHGCLWVQIFQKQDDDENDYSESLEDKCYEKAQNTYFHAVETVKDVAKKASKGMVGVARSRRLAQNIVELVMEDKTLMIGITTLKEFDDYTYTHSVNVALLATCLGRHIGLSNIALEHLCICSLFHDLGKVGVPKEILFKQGALTDGEWNQIKEHPLIGVRKILMLNASPSLRSRIILGPFEHHLNPDMTGYPRTMFMSHISLMGKILHICDVYEALTSARVYRTKSFTPHEALRKMWGEAEKSFDVIMLKSFIHMIGIYPIGSVVELGDGSVGLVIDYPDEDEWTLPLVLRLVNNEKDGWQRGELIYITDQINKDGSGRLNIVRGILPERLQINPADFFLHLK
jgi:HD-GYP domain-containing protein (c-di-GMP phosphodiesterase class II)